MRKPTIGMMWALGAVFLCTPFYLNASAPRNARSVTVTPRVTQGTVSGVRVAARLDRGARDRLSVRVTAVNPSDKPAVARVRVDVFERRAMSRFARMAPPPMKRGNATLELRLAPRQRLVTTVPVKQGNRVVAMTKAALSRAWLAVRPAVTTRHASRAASARHPQAWQRSGRKAVAAR